MSSAPGSTTLAPQNLVMTATVRSELIAVVAASGNLPPSAFTGLVPGESFYAYDPVTRVYWAGAGLVPSPASLQAEVIVQDDGSYLLFDRPAGGSWKAHDVGLAGIAGTRCPVQPPASILSLWDWAPGTCRPRALG